MFFCFSPHAERHGSMSNTRISVHQDIHPISRPPKHSADYLDTIACRWYKSRNCKKYPFLKIIQCGCSMIPKVNSFDAYRYSCRRLIWNVGTLIPLALNGLARALSPTGEKSQTTSPHHLNATKRGRRQFIFRLISWPVLREQKKRLQNVLFLPPPNSFGGRDSELSR